MSSKEATKEKQTLEFTFDLSQTRKGKVTASVVENVYPEQYGCDLLMADHPTPHWVGFPVCEATVRSTGAKGYGAMYGWVQLAKVEDKSSDKSHDWEMDPIPALKSSDYPFVVFGAEPTMFDAPMQEEIKNVKFTARSFLTYLPDCLLSKDVRPILGFEWGFWKTGKEIKFKELRKLDLSVWDGHLPHLNESHSSWTFRESKFEENQK